MAAATRFLRRYTVGMAVRRWGMEWPSNGKCHRCELAGTVKEAMPCGMEWHSHGTCYCGESAGIMEWRMKRYMNNLNGLVAMSSEDMGEFAPPFSLPSKDKRQNFDVNCYKFFQYFPHPLYVPPQPWRPPPSLQESWGPLRFIFIDGVPVDIFGSVGDIHKISLFSRNRHYIDRVGVDAIQEYKLSKTKHNYEHHFYDHALRGTSQLIAGCNIYHIVFKATKGFQYALEIFEAVGFGMHVGRPPSMKLVLFRKYNSSKNLPVSLNEIVGEICECASPCTDPMITNAAHFAVAEFNKKNEVLGFERVIRATTQVIKATSEVIRVYKIIRLKFEALESGELNSYDAVVLVHEHDADKMELMHLWICGAKN